MAYSPNIAMAGLSLLAAYSLGQEMSARPSCRLLIDKVGEYDDATVGLMCRLSIAAKKCSAMISSLGSRPWSEPQREAACEHFEEDLLRRRILFEFPKLPGLSKLADNFANQADQVTKQGQSKALENATAMIDQAVSMADEAAGMADNSLANSTMDTVTSAKKNVSASLDDVHASADKAKKALREDLMDSVGKLTAHGKNFSHNLNEEVQKQMDTLQTALGLNQDSLNKILGEASKASAQTLAAQKSAMDTATELLSSWNKHLDKTDDPELKRLAGDTNNAMNGLQDLLKGLPKGVKVPDFLNIAKNAATASALAEVKPVGDLEGVMDQIMDATDGKNITAAVDKAEGALGRVSKIENGTSDAGQKRLSGLKGILGGVLRQKYEKNKATDISNGPLVSFAGFAVLAAAITGVAVATQRLRPHQRHSLRVASTVMTTDEEGGAE